MSLGVPGRFVDTSMLVRYFTDDIPEQAALAEAIIEHEPMLLLTAVVLVECAYVLTRLYTYPRDQVVDVLVQFLGRPNVRLSDLPKERATEALLRCRASGRVSFGDALIVAAALASGVTEIYSFDRRMAAAGIRVLSVRA